MKFDANYKDLQGKLLSSENFLGRIIGFENNTLIVRSLIDEKIVEIPVEEIKNYKILDKKPDFKGNSELILLYLNLLRFKHAYLNDELYAINTSNIDPLPHQIEAVYDYMLKAVEKTGRLRFLLADDVGAGKTIMAGLVIKELIHRYGIKKILIVVPKILEDKWKNDLQSKFFFKNVHIISSKNWEGFKSLVFTNQDFIRGIFIVSVDFAKQPDKKEIISSINWDLVIFDEAHKLSARAYGLFGYRKKKTQRYKLAEELAKKSKHLLLLTATPHTGHTDKFIFLLRLLDENLFSEGLAAFKIDPEKIREILINGPVPMFLRRLKTEFKDLSGKKLIPERKVITVKFELTREELELYKEMSKYIKFLYRQARQSRNYWLVMLIFQKRFASSLYAAKRSLERRLSALRELDRNKSRKALRQNSGDLDLDYDTDLAENSILSQVYVHDKEVIEQEISYVRNLLEKFEIFSGQDTKLQKLIDILKSIKEKNPNEKIVIFSEYKDTIEYLQENLSIAGFRCRVIHGSMPYEDKLKELEAFKTSDTDVLLATDAAGEGIDLQDICHIMINYDIPWSPVKLEQRMGRIHRYGQHKTPYIYNFVAINTAEGLVLGKLLEKLEEIRKFLGEKIYDIIGEIIDDEKAFIESVSKAAVEGKENVINRFLSKEVVENKAKTIEKFVVKPKDVKLALEKLELSKKRRIVPEYFEKILLRVFEIVLGYKPQLVKEDVISDNQIIRIYKIPANLLTTKLGLQFSQPREWYYFTVYPQAFRKYSHDKIDFLTPEHPVFDRLLLELRKIVIKDLIRGGTVIPEKDIPEGLLHIYLLKVKNRNIEQILEQRLVVLLESKDKIKELPEDILAYLLPITSENIVNTNKISSSENIVESKMSEIKEMIKEEKLEKIERMIESQLLLIENIYEEILDKLYDKIYELQKRLEMEIDSKTRENLEKQIQKLEHQKEKYLESKVIEVQQINQWRNIEILSKKITTLYVLPINKLGNINLKVAENLQNLLMHEDPEVEHIAMKVAMEYECQNGRQPRDVSQEFLGYDIESWDPRTGKMRFIEVKGRAGEGDIVMTQHEWATAEKLGDQYWLYVVFNVKRHPRQRLTLITIQNPVKKLRPVVEKRYHISLKDILNQIKQNSKFHKINNKNISSQE
jgi:SNF2 family DNA or RNA helicase